MSNRDKKPLMHPYGHAWTLELTDLEGYEHWVCRDCGATRIEYGRAVFR